MKSSIFFALSSVLCLTASFAETLPDNSVSERNKAKIVSRLYEATYGSSEKCKAASPDAAREFKSELKHFADANPALIKLLTHSPYYETARKQFFHHAPVDRQHDTPETLSRECQYLSFLLRSMSDTPEGKQAAKEFENILSK